MGLELIAGPAIEPVSLTEAKAHLRVDNDDEDALIARLVIAAREFAERNTGRAFIVQSWKLWCDGWPENRALAIPRPPLIAVSSIAVYDRSGASTTLSSDAYIVDSAGQPGRIVLTQTAMLPVTLREANAIAVSYTAGYGAYSASVPAGLRTAILSHVAHLYETRGAEVTQPPQILAMLSPFRVIGL